MFAAYKLSVNGLRWDCQPNFMLSKFGSTVCCGLDCKIRTFQVTLHKIQFIHPELNKEPCFIHPFDLDEILLDLPVSGPPYAPELLWSIRKHHLSFPFLAMMSSCLVQLIGVINLCDCFVCFFTTSSTVTCLSASSAHCSHGILFQRFPQSLH